MRAARSPALGGCGRLDNLGSFGRVDDDFLPADAGAKLRSRNASLEPDAGVS